MTVIGTMEQIFCIINYNTLLAACHKNTSGLSGIKDDLLAVLPVYNTIDFDQL